MHKLLEFSRGALQRGLTQAPLRLPRQLPNARRGARNQASEQSQLFGEPAGCVGHQHETEQFGRDRARGPVAQSVLSGEQTPVAGACDKQQPGWSAGVRGERPGVIGGPRGGQQRLKRALASAAVHPEDKPHFEQLLAQQHPALKLMGQVRSGDPRLGCQWLNRRWLARWWRRRGPWRRDGREPWIGRGAAREMPAGWI